MTIIQRRKSAPQPSRFVQRCRIALFHVVDRAEVEITSQRFAMDRDAPAVHLPEVGDAERDEGIGIARAGAANRLVQSHRYRAHFGAVRRTVVVRAVPGYGSALQRGRGVRQGGKAGYLWLSVNCDGIHGELERMEEVRAYPAPARLALSGF